MDQEAIDKTCRAVYEEAKQFFSAMALEPWFKGFQILYGPPLQCAPVIFVGYQPGRGLKSPEEERAYGSEDRWPQVSEYVTEDWALATWLKRMFGPQRLKHWVGSNVIFARAHGINEYKKTFPKDKRAAIESFCLQGTKRMVDAIEPKLIVAIGFDALRSLTGKTGKPDLLNDRGRVLTLTDEFAGRPVIGVLHLSGAQISTADRGRIADRVLTMTD